MQCACFQNKYGDVQGLVVDHVRDDHVFGAQARGLSHGTELGNSLLKQPQRLCQFARVGGTGVGIQSDGLALSVVGNRVDASRRKAQAVVFANKGRVSTAEPW